MKNFFALDESGLRRFMQKRLFPLLPSFLGAGASVALIAVVAFAATTINDNISTGGAVAASSTLQVTGNALFYSNIGFGTSTPGHFISLVNTDSTKGFFVVSTSTSPFDDAASLQHMAFEINAAGEVGIGVQAQGGVALSVDAVERPVVIGGILGTNKSTGLMFQNIFTQHAGIRWTNDGSRNLVVEDASNGGNPSSWYSRIPVNLIVRNGSLGISTTSPYGMLSVAGSIIGQNIIATSSANNSGFGTSTPASNLTVSSSGTTTLFLDSTTIGNGTCIQMRTAGTLDRWAKLFIDDGGNLKSELGSC